MSYDLKIENGDLRISNTGDLAVVKDNEKLLQDALKILLTPLGGNKAHTWYGSNVGDTLIGAVFDKDFSIDAASQQVRSAMDNLQMIQKSQSKTQIVTAAETISVVKDIYLNSNIKDQRLIEARITLLTNALTLVAVKFIVRL